jgi:hypothetical protein
MAKKPKYDPVKKSEYNKRAHAKARNRYLEGYGSQCTCCGETTKEFLTVHHVDGGGGKERGGSGSSLIWKKISGGFPAGLEVLCWNCHQAIENYGYCPHKQRPKAEAR